MELLNLSYEEMEQAILDRVEYTYGVERGLHDDIALIEGAGIMVKELTFDNIKVEISINEPIEVDENTFISSYNLKFL